MTPTALQHEFIDLLCLSEKVDRDSLGPIHTIESAGQAIDYLVDVRDKRWRSIPIEPGTRTAIQMRIREQPELRTPAYEAAGITSTAASSTTTESQAQRCLRYMSGEPLDLRPPDPAFLARFRPKTKRPLGRMQRRPVQPWDQLDDDHVLHPDDLAAARAYHRTVPRGPDGRIPEPPRRSWNDDTGFGRTTTWQEAWMQQCMSHPSVTRARQEVDARNEVNWERWVAHAERRVS